MILVKHVVSIDDFQDQEMNYLFRITDQIRQSPQHYADSLEGKVVATLFYEPSTRTRLSFEAAIQRLGGKVISTENARELSSAVKGEKLEDTIRVVQGYSDAIVLRHYEDQAAEIAAKVADVPVINAGCGAREHPTQALLDLYTIYSLKGTIDGLTYVISGDLLYGRTVHSLVKKLAHYPNVKIYGLSRPEFALPQAYVDYLAKYRITYLPCTDFDEIPPDVDVIYHTRTQLERINKQITERAEIIIDQQVMNRFSKNTILMHPLPRNREIAPEVDQDERAVYFQQSRNGMYVRMALLHILLHPSVMSRSGS